MPRNFNDHYSSIPVQRSYESSDGFFSNSLFGSVQQGQSLDSSGESNISFLSNLFEISKPVKDDALTSSTKTSKQKNETMVLSQTKINDNSKQPTVEVKPYTKMEKQQSEIVRIKSGIVPMISKQHGDNEVGQLSAKFLSKPQSARPSQVKSRTVAERKSSNASQEVNMFSSSISFDTSMEFSNFVEWGNQVNDEFFNWDVKKPSKTSSPTSVTIFGA